MKYIDSEKLIAEIERLQKFNHNMADNAINSNMRNFYDGAEDCGKQLISFITTLQQEQPDDLASLISEATNVAKRIVDWDSFYNSLPQNLRNKYTSKAWCEILEALSTMKEQEQPEVDLDREIIKYKVPFTDENEYLNETTLDAIARHFAEWGAIHLNARKEEAK